MGNIDRSRLAKELEPYIASQIRSMLNAALTKSALPTLKASGGGGLTPPAPLTTHVLATASALGAYHTISGATAGHVLRASASNAAAFAQLLHSDLGNVTADQHHNQSHAYDSADHTGTLSWSKINFTGSSLGDLATRNYAQLNSRTHDIIGGDHSYTGGAALDVFGLSAASTLARITPSDSVSSAQTAILKATNGALSIDVLTATAKVRSPLYDTGSGSITLSPAGTAVLPTGSILKDMGDYNRKWRTLYAAELYVETLVAQDVLATIGGRIMVAPTTTLIADVASSDTTIDVKHNNITGAYVYLSSAPGGVAQVEVMLVTAGPSVITGGYRYTVQRNKDGTFANNWVAGDAVASIGAAAGQGWIDLTSTNTVYNHLGPTMTIYSRTGMASWQDAKPVVSVGNLRSWVDYGADEFGFALGNDLALTATTGFSGMTGDRTNGLRLFNSPIAMYNGATLVGLWGSSGQLDIGFDGISTLADRDFTVHASGYVRIGREGTNKPNLLYTAGGDLQLRSNTTPVITLAGSGNSYFSGVMTIGTSGEIRQGTVSSGNVWDSWASVGAGFTGLRMWRESNMGRIAGYSGGVLQAGFGTDGKLTAGAGAVTLDASGIDITAATGWEEERSYQFSNGGVYFGGLGCYTDSGATGNVIIVESVVTGSRSPNTLLWAKGSAAYPGDVHIRAQAAGGDDASLFLNGHATAATASLTAAGGITITGITTFANDIMLGGALDTTSGTTLELKQSTTSILRSQKTSADAYLRLGNGRTVDGLAYFDLIGDGAGSVGIRFIRNGGANGSSQLRHYGTGIFEIATQGAADMQLRTNGTTRMTLQSDGLAKFASSVAVGGDYGGTASHLTLTNVTSAAGGAGGGTIKMAGATGRNNAGWIKYYSGTTEIWQPYWTIITG